MSDHVPASKTYNREPLTLLWRFLAAPPAMLVLMALAAGSLVLSTLIPQIPQDVAGDPEAWLALQSGLLGGGNRVLYSLGLFDIFHAAWFRLILVLAGVVLFVWTVESADVAWRATRARGASPAFAAWQASPLRALLPAARSVGQAESDVREALESQGYRWAGVPDQPFPTLVAGRRERLLWAQPVAFAALLVSLAALAVGANWGWRSTAWSPAVGESRAVRQGTPYAVRLDSFEQAPRGYRSSITWLSTEHPERSDLVHEGRPSVLHGLAVRQIGTAPAVVVRGMDGAGQPLLFRSSERGSPPTPEIDVTFEAAAGEQLIRLPDPDLFLLFSYEDAASGGRPAVHVSLLRGTEAAQEPAGVLYESGELRIDELVVEVELTRRPILRVDYQPAMIAVVGGLAVAVMALAAGWLFGPHLLWLTVAPGQDCPVLVRVLAAGGAGDRAWFDRLVAGLREALTRGA